MTEVTREMIGAAHDICLKKGDFVLSADLLERIFKAMLAAAPTPPKQPRQESEIAAEALEEAAEELNGCHTVHECLCRLDDMIKQKREAGR